MKIISALNRASDDEYFSLDLGSFENVMVSTTCKVHTRILSLGLYPKADVYRNVTKFSVNQVRGRGAMIYGQCDYNIPYVVFGLELLPTPSSNTPNRRGKIVNPQWIEKSIFRRWKQYCNSRQNRDCLLAPMATRLAPTRPTWLIDTWKLCLTRGDNGAPYVALSYVCEFITDL